MPWNKKKMSCKDEVKTDYSREHILLYVVHRDKSRYFSLRLILVPFSVPFVTHTWVFPGPEKSAQDGWTIGALRSICRLILPSSGTRSAKTFAISMEISDMHECLTSLPRRLMPPLQHLHLQKGCWWFSATSAPPKFCKGLTAQSHGKFSLLIWDRNCMKLFSCVGKIQFGNLKWEGPKLLLWEEKRGGERHRKHRETRGKLGKGN